MLASWARERIGGVRDEAQPMAVFAQAPHGVGGAGDRLAGDVQDAVDVEENCRHDRSRVYSRHPQRRSPACRDRVAHVAFERAGRPARAEVGDARRGGLRRRGVERALDGQKKRVLAKAGPVLRAVAQDERSQLRNKELATERLVEALREALHVERKRVPTKPTKAAKERRLDDKKPSRRGEAAAPRSWNERGFGAVLDDEPTDRSPTAEA